MKYYNYSVKDLLLKKFGSNTLLKMRDNYNGAAFDDYATNEESAEALMWQDADQSALGYFFGKIFYDETVLEDDYIVYFGHTATDKYAIVTFAHDAKYKLEDLPTKYAYDVCHKYEALVDTVWLLQQTNKGAYYLRHSNYTGSGYISVPKKVNGEYILADILDDEWEMFFERFLSGFCSDDKKDWQLLFCENVKVKFDDNVIIDGLDEFFDQKDAIIDKYGDPDFALVRYCLNYKSTFKGLTYDKPYYIYYHQLCSSCFTYNFAVNKHNQVCEVNISEIVNDYNIIRVYKPIGIGIDFPKLLSVIPLDYDEIQTVAFEATFEDGTVKIFYFDNVKDDKTFEYNGRICSYNELQNIKLDADKQGVIIGNDGFIPDYIIFSRSLRQFYPERLGNIIYEDEELKIESLYREPLRKSWRSGSRYYGNGYEIFGPNNCFIDENGYRKSKISFWDSKQGKGNIIAVNPEYTNLYGILRKKDCTWTEVPKFTRIYDFNGYDCCNAELESKRVFISSTGKLLPNVPHIEVNNFCSELCLVKFKNLEEDKYPSPFPFNPEYQYELGLYGFVNTEGKIAIKPQYIYATGFYETDGNYAFVAKYIDSCIRWGMIDTSGKEIIPCKYPQLHFAYNGISYYDSEGRCGLMDMCGNIITEPMFASIRDYNKSTNILLFENKEELYGAYNCSTKKIIIEPLYEDVDIDHEWLEVDTVDEDNYHITQYFDLNGNPIDYPKEKINYRNIPVVELSVLKKHQSVTDFKGLCDDMNNIIIPAIYSKLRYYDGLIIASETKTTNWKYRETIYKPDGTVVLKGAYREIEIRDGYIKALTPEGKVTFKLTCKK